MVGWQKVSCSWSEVGGVTLRLGGAELRVPSRPVVPETDRENPGEARGSPT